MLKKKQFKKMIVVLFNEKGEIFLQKRKQKNKKNSCWDTGFTKQTIPDNGEFINKILVNEEIVKEILVYKVVQNKPSSKKGKFISIPELRQLLRNEESFNQELIQALRTFNLDT